MTVLLAGLLLAASCWAQTTRTWEQSTYSEFERGSAHGVAISSDGALTLAPTFNQLYTSPSTYIWDLASDSEGNVYAAAGSPARVYKLTPAGKARIIFAPEELQVQAIAVDPNSGAIYAATSPDGKVYKLMHGGPAPRKALGSAHTTAEVAAAQEGAGSSERPLAAEVDFSYSASVYFDPKTKYIWALALDRQGRLYIGTGDSGEIFRVDRDGKGSLFFKSDETQIRALGFDHQGELIAGTDGSGLIYRISPQGEGFVLYSAPKKEITALAVDGQGNIYAAGAGKRREAALPASGAGIVVTAPSAGGVPTTSLGPHGSGAPSAIGAGPSVARLGGSEIYRLSLAGPPKTIWSSRDDLVYALAFDRDGRLLAGTGNRGKIYAVDGHAYTDLAEASASQVTAFAPAPQGGLYAATSNLGKVFRLGPQPVSEGTYESDVLDARIFSKWGRVEVRGRGTFQIFARSGNVDNPDRNWSPWKPVDLQRDLPIDAPAARFIQWKAVLKSAQPMPKIESVLVNYLPSNVAPDVDEVTVLVGSRVPAGGHSEAANSTATADEAPRRAVKDRQSIAVEWKAHDEDGDKLVYDVYYRGDGETEWKLLRKNVAERFVNLDSDLFPDGGYTIRVVASDAPSRSADDTLTGEATSPHFEVDNTPPQIESLRANAQGGEIYVSFRAVDGFSPISHAEYSINAGEWQVVEPVGQISDSKTENYDFTIAVPEGAGQNTHDIKRSSSSKEYVIIVRAYDRFDNMGVGKVVVRTGQ
ncbi:MAG TPA: two-component regulator propeller domain-containing protein [Terriglobales bacterium]|nr:two-component regulator propeller domain-containing protein [Terriglobales bacterium]